MEASNSLSKLMGKIQDDNIENAFELEADP